MIKKLKKLQAVEDYNKQFNVDDALLSSVVFFCEDSILITTTNLNSPGPEIVYVNPGFTRMTGYLPEEVLGKTPKILQGPNTDVKVLRELRVKLENEKVFYGEAINYKKDGTEFWNEWHIEPMRNSDGEMIYYLAIQHDVTQRKIDEMTIIQKNTALKEVLEQIELEKKSIKEDIQVTVEEVLLPILTKMKRKGTQLDKKYIDILRNNVQDLSSSFGTIVSERKYKISPREVEVANLIKNGLSTRNICDLLNVSHKTIETHRNKIRRKLGILNKDVNLNSYLKSY